MMTKLLGSCWTASCFCIKNESVLEYCSQTLSANSVHEDYWYIYWELALVLTQNLVLQPVHTWEIHKPGHRRHDMSVFVAHDSTLYTLATGLRQQAFGDVNEPWPSTSLILSQPFLITTAIVPIVIKWRAMYSHCFFGYAASWFVSLFLNQRALLFVSPRWLLLVLWLAAAAPHTTLNRAIHILSMHVAHGCVIAKQCCMAWLELAHGAVPQNPVVYYCHVAKGMCVHQLYLGHFGWQERWTWDFFFFFFYKCSNL